MDINSLREREIRAFSVSELNGYIKNLFESNRTLTAVTVKGEISNFTNHRSGHLYFSLKDSEGQIRAVMFKSSAARLKFIPESGMKVVAHGSVSVYARDGSYQLYVSSLQPDGIGALYLAYEQLKERLAEEGIFDEEYKRPIPLLPERIGIITSPTGAAVRDIINVTGRRYPLADLYLYPSLVQGDGAEENLISALDYFNRTKLVDVIIIGRGGGSIEDLWAFNGERLARKIFECEIPVISAVGHETDFTICDFVSDLRAPTPSAAAELAVPDVRELILRADSFLERAEAALLRSVERARDRFDRYSEKVSIDAALSMLFEKRETVDLIYENAKRALKLCFDGKNNSFALAAKKLEVLSPLAVLSRGYTISEKDSKPLSSVGSVLPGDVLDVRFVDGVAMTRVIDIEKQNYNSVKDGYSDGK